MSSRRGQSAGSRGHLHEMGMPLEQSKTFYRAGILIWISTTPLTGMGHYMFPVDKRKVALF
jgi:hypothetical protein